MTDMNDEDLTTAYMLGRRDGRKDAERGQALSTVAGSSARKAFEDWYEADAMPFEHSNWFKRDDDGDYHIMAVDNAWTAWEAAIRWKNSEPTRSRDSINTNDQQTDL